MYGDSYLPIDYGPVALALARERSQGLMCVFLNNGQWDQSTVRIESGQVIFYSKKAKPGEANYIDYGLLGLRRRVIEGYREREPPLDLAVVLGDLVAAGALAAYEVHQRFYEIGKPEGLKELDAWLRGHPAGTGAA